MKTLMKTMLVVTALSFAGQALAQTEADERVREIEAREAEFAQKMLEAEERLAEAAAQVAELSQQRLPQIANLQRYVYDFSTKPRMGVTIEVTDEGTPVEGVRIIAVTPNSPADEAGLRTGDVLTAVNGETLSAENIMEANKILLDFMQGVEEGDTLDVEYLRDGKVGKLEVQPRIIGPQAYAWAGAEGNFSMPQFPQLHVAPNGLERYRLRFGSGWRGTWGDMEVVELTEGLGRYFGIDKGLLIISAPDSNAFKLQEGDVILSIDGREPSSVNHCMRILSSYQPGEKLVFNIMRDKKRDTIEIEIPDDRTSQVFDEMLRQIAPVVAPLPGIAPLPEVTPLEEDHT
ncbi:MAG: PDZ domain-containing protein [Woeseiaceae bacterium]